MLNVIYTNTIAGPGTPIVWGPVAQAGAQKLGIDLSAQQAEELAGVLVILVRYAHLEAPKVKAALACGFKQIAAAAAWITAHDGLFPLVKRFLGWTTKPTGKLDTSGAPLPIVPPPSGKVISANTLPLGGG